MRRLGIIGLVIVTACPGALAWHGAPEPLLDAVPFDAPHWAAWRLVLPSEGNVVIEVSVPAADIELVGLGTSVLAANGSSLGSAWVLAQVATTHLFVESLGDAPLVDLREGLGDGVFQGAITWVLPAGEYVAVGIVTAVGELGSGALELRASGGASLLAATEGTGAFAAVARDFAGALNVRAGVGPGGPQAVAIVDAAHAHAIDRALFAFFWRHPSTSLNPLHSVLCDIRYDGPDGGGEGAQYYFIEAAPPGAYTFRVPHCVDAGAGPFRTQLFVVGADVALP